MHGFPGKGHGIQQSLALCDVLGLECHLSIKLKEKKITPFLNSIRLEVDANATREGNTQIPYSTTLPTASQICGVLLHSSSVAGAVI